MPRERPASPTMIPVDAVRMEGDTDDGCPPTSATFIRAVSKQIAAMRVGLRMGLPVLTKEDLRRSATSKRV